MKISRSDNAESKIKVCLPTVQKFFRTAFASQKLDGCCQMYFAPINGADRPSHSPYQHLCGTVQSMLLEQCAIGCRSRKSVSHFDILENTLRNTVHDLAWLISPLQTDHRKMSTPHLMSYQTTLTTRLQENLTAQTITQTNRIPLFIDNEIHPKNPIIDVRFYIEYTSTKYHK